MTRNIGFLFGLVACLALSCAADAQSPLPAPPNEPHPSVAPPGASQPLPERIADYRIIAAIDSLAGRTMPAIAAWSQRELAVCARYAAVQIDRRWQANLDLAASLRSC